MFESDYIPQLEHFNDNWYITCTLPQTHKKWIRHVFGLERFKNQVITDEIDNIYGLTPMNDKSYQFLDIKEKKSDQVTKKFIELITSKSYFISISEFKHKLAELRGNGLSQYLELWKNQYNLLKNQINNYYKNFIEILKSMKFIQNGHTRDHRFKLINSDALLDMSFLFYILLFENLNQNKNKYFTTNKKIEKFVKKFILYHLLTESELANPTYKNLYPTINDNLKKYNIDKEKYLNDLEIKMDSEISNLWNNNDLLNIIIKENKILHKPLFAIYIASVFYESDSSLFLNDTFGISSVFNDTGSKGRKPSQHHILAKKNEKYTKINDSVLEVIANYTLTDNETNSMLNNKEITKYISEKYHNTDMINERNKNLKLWDIPLKSDIEWDYYLKINNLEDIERFFNERGKLMIKRIQKFYNNMIYV